MMKHLKYNNVIQLLNDHMHDLEAMEDNSHGNICTYWTIEEEIRPMIRFLEQERDRVLLPILDLPIDVISPDVVY